MFLCARLRRHTKTPNLSLLIFGLYASTEAHVSSGNLGYI